MRRGIQLGILIENTDGGIFRAEPGTPESARRIDADGTRAPYLNPFDPFFTDKATFLVRRLMELFAEFPACSTIFFNSELEDKLKLPFNPDARRRHERRLGFPLSQLRGTERVFAESYPTTRSTVPDDDPEVAYARYYFREGDGWCRANRLMNDTAKVYRPDLLTVADPLRLAPMPERFDGVDLISSWSYTNPDPKLMLFCETLAAAGRRTGKPFIHTITLWNYAGTLTPCEEDRFAREYTMRMGPDRWKECCWINLARGPRAIGCYFGSPLEPLLSPAGDPRLYSPETEPAIAEFNREILRPFGKLARATTQSPRRAAVLDCFTSRIHGNVPRSYAHYQNYQIYDFYTVMNLAQIPADVVFEEDLLEDALDRYELLALPAADVLPESVYEKILIFVRRGGTVIADGYCKAKIPGLIRFDFDFTYRKQVNANTIATGSDFAVTDDTNFRADWGGRVTGDGATADDDQFRLENYAITMRERLAQVKTLSPRDFDCGSVKVLANRRRGGAIDYLFLVNDHRTWDARSGKYRAMMERGVPEIARCRIAPPHSGPAFLYEMTRGKTLPVFVAPDGYWEFDAPLPAAGGAIIAVGAHDLPPELSVERTPEGIRLHVTSPDSTTTLKLIKLELFDSDGTVKEMEGTRLLRNGTLTLTVPENCRHAIVTDLTNGRTVERNL